MKDKVLRELGYKRMIDKGYLITYQKDIFVITFIYVNYQWRIRIEDIAHDPINIDYRTMLGITEIIEYLKINRNLGDSNETD